MAAAGGAVVEQTQDDAEVVARVAALDIGKAEVVCCVRTPGPDGSTRRTQEIRTFSAMTRSLAAMSDWLAGLGVTRVVMEATSDYWKAPFFLLEDRVQTWLGNAPHGKHPPRRPQTHPLGAGWVWQGARGGDVLGQPLVPPRGPGIS